MAKAGVVWILIGDNDEKLVIKYERIVKPVLKSLNPIVKAVAPGAALKFLTDVEVSQLKEFVFFHELFQTTYSDFGMEAYKPHETAAVAALKTNLNNSDATLNFVKMAALNVVDLKDALEQRLASDPNKASLRSFTETLKANGGLERLGQILAVDLFVGNLDRFSPFEGSPRTIAGQSFPFRSLINISNVFKVDLTDGSSEVGALDFVDAYNPFKLSTVPLAVAEQADPTIPQWPGRVLADARRRKEFAENVVHDLELILHPHKSRFSLKKKLGFFAAGRVDAGLVEGTRKIKGKLVVKYPYIWKKFLGNTVTQGDEANYGPIKERYDVVANV